MTKNERTALIALYTDAMQVNLNTSLHYPHPTYQFNRGYEWGIECAMRAAGMSKAEIYEIWNEITTAAYRTQKGE